jgi:hypothetical protein
VGGLFARLLFNAFLTASDFERSIQQFVLTVVYELVPACMNSVFYPTNFKFEIEDEGGFIGCVAWEETPAKEQN